MTTHYDSIAAYTADVVAARLAYRADRLAADGLCVSCERRRRDRSCRVCRDCRRQAAKDRAHSPPP